MESTSYVLPFRMVFFYLVTTGWILTSAYVGIQFNSIQFNCNSNATHSHAHEDALRKTAREMGVTIKGVHE